MSKTWKAVFGVILIYLLGCLSGAVATSIFFHHKMLGFLHHPGVVLSAVLEKRLTGNLGLDASQKQQVHAYFAENLQHRKELQKEIQPQVQALNRQTIKQVAAILHPGQAQLFHETIEKLRKRFGANGSDQDTESPPAPQPSPASPATNSGAGHPPSTR
jgi:hypothetical protein